MTSTNPTPWGTAAYRLAVEAGKERPGLNVRAVPGEVRDRLHAYLDDLGSRVPTPDELARLAVLASSTFVPRSAAMRTLAAFVRFIEAHKAATRRRVK